MLKNIVNVLKKVRDYNFEKIVQKVADRGRFVAVVKNKARNLHKRASSRDFYANFMKVKEKVKSILIIHG